MTAAASMSYSPYINPQAVTMFNMSSLLNQKDSRWLQLEVCRESQRQKCTRSDAECKFAHPPPNVEVQNGRVTACYDSIKGRCNREKPACKYFHPPQHLKDQLLINGRNHLALKNALAQQMQQQMIPGQVPTVFGPPPYLGASVPLAYSPYLTSGLVSPLLGSEQQLQHHGQPGQQPQPQPHIQQNIQNKQRPERIESVMGLSAVSPVSPVSPVSHYQCLQSHHQPILPLQVPSQYGPGLTTEQLGQLAIASLAAGGGKKRPRESGDELLLTLPPGSVMPYKRAASEKSGLPVYQPTGVQQQQQQHQQQHQQLQQQQAAYHQILQIQQQPSIVPGTATYGTTAPQPIAIPRYQ